MAKSPSSVSEHLVYSTVRIKTVGHDGREGLATGFFFERKVDESRQFTVLVTNKHVVKGASKGSFLMHCGEAQGDEIRPLDSSRLIECDDFTDYWFPHPVDAIDLTAFAVGGILNRMMNEGSVPFYRTLDEPLVWDDKTLEKLSAAEEVLMVGYPEGLWDEVNNFPLHRRGISSIHPSVDFQGQPVGVVDIACFPGSSGSPVCIANEGGYTEGGTLYGGKNRIVLLGVLFAGPVRKQDGTFEIRDIPTQAAAIPVVSQMIHLGFYVKAKELLRLCDAFRADIDSGKPSVRIAG